MKKNLTSLFVENAVAKKDRDQYYDTKCTGLVLRVTASGTKTFQFVYRLGGIQRRHTIGRYPSWSLAAVRKEVLRLQLDIHKGVDPRAEKNAMRARPLVNEVMDDFIKRHVSALKDPQATTRILDKDVRPYIGRLFIHDVKKRHLIPVFDRVKKRGADTMANRVFEIVRKMFNWAVAKDIIPHTPCAGLERPTKAENRRDRTLSDFETQNFWVNLDLSEMSRRYKLALKIMLLTGQRKGEVIGARKAEFDLGEKVWTIPATRSKNKEAHQVPLTQTVLDLIEDVAAGDETSEWLFEAYAHGKALGKPVLPGAINKQFTAARPFLDVPYFRIHDLRRTASTIMGREGISEYNIGKVLNHKNKSVTAIYNRHSYMAEKRFALEVLERSILTILADEQNAPNVLQFKQTS